ncbi:MAG: hypothetical protein(), partial [uncultured Solirubrobacterales bacterium]
GRAREHRRGQAGQRPLPRSRGRRLRLEVGDRLRRARPPPGRRQADPRARAPARALRAGARDRGRHGVLHAQPLARRGDRRRGGHRHLIRNAQRARGLGGGARPRGRDRPRRGRAAALPRRLVRPRLRPRGAAPPAGYRAGLCRVRAGAAPGRHARLLRRALALRRPPGHRPEARGAGGRAGVAAHPAGPAAPPRGRPCLRSRSAGTGGRRSERGAGARGGRRRPRLYADRSRPPRAPRRPRGGEDFGPGVDRRLVRLGQPYARGDGRARAAPPALVPLGPPRLPHAPAARPGRARAPAAGVGLLQPADLRAPARPARRRRRHRPRL